jgi:hypothetical protein
LHCEARELVSIDGQVRLVGMQTDIFRLYLRKQTDNEQTSDCMMNNGQQIKVNSLGFRFHIFICVYTYRYIYMSKTERTENDQGKKISFVGCKQKT